MTTEAVVDYYSSESEVIVLYDEYPPLTYMRTIENVRPFTRPTVGYTLLAIVDSAGSGDRLFAYTDILWNYL